MYDAWANVSRSNPPGTVERPLVPLLDRVEELDHGGRGDGVRFELRGERGASRPDPVMTTFRSEAYPKLPPNLEDPAA